MKKTLISIITLAILPSTAFGASTTIQLPPSFTATIWENVNSILTGLNDYTTMIIGTILAVTVIVILIETLANRGK